MIALDATYSVGEHLSGVGVYCREILFGLARSHPEESFRFCYRAHRILRSLGEKLPPNTRRFLLQEPLLPRRAKIFHGLNQRLPRGSMPRTVTTFHDLFVLTGDYSTAEFRNRFADQARDAALRSDLIIAVSQFTADQVTGLLKVERSRLRVIPHGVHAPPAQLAAPRERMILHVGALQTRKNIIRLVEAFERTPGDWRLVLAGSAGFGAAEILSRIESSPARERISAPGYVNAESLAEYYARASILAFPSLDEGFGIPVLEAMAAGVPVVTSRRSAMIEVAGDAALLVDPERTDEIASALSTLIGNEALRKEFAARGLARTAAYTWDHALKKTWEVYRELF